MKKLSYSLLLIVALVISSCNKEEINFSCDEVTNNWVKANLDQIQKMDVKEWPSLADSLKIPVYRAFSYKQRIEFWIQRFKSVKQMKWSKDELKHIEKAENFFYLHLEMFSNNKLTDTQLNELELFSYTWMNEAIEQFGWTHRTGNLIIGSGYTIKNTEVMNDETIPIERRAKDKKISCHCHGGNIIFHSCYADYTICQKTDRCEIGSSHGCGAFLAEECDGLCM